MGRVRERRDHRVADQVVDEVRAAGAGGVVPLVPGGGDLSRCGLLLGRNDLLRGTGLLELSLHRGYATLCGSYVVQQLAVLLCELVDLS